MTRSDLEASYFDYEILFVLCDEDTGKNKDCKTYVAKYGYPILPIRGKY